MLVDFFEYIAVRSFHSSKPNLKTYLIYGFDNTLGKIKRKKN
jgi:hypothetical protein